MPDVRLAPVLDYLRRLIGRTPTDADDDLQLLERFVRAREEAAFTELMRRHGPMVLGVCQRVLHDAHLAEDAFQAVFLVLARKAASIRQRQAVAGWLCRVAYHTAGTLRTRTARQRLREREKALMVSHDSPDPAEGQELRSILDEEMQRLPDRFHAPLVLCALEGKSHEEAARALGLPEGTLKSRLARGRERLRTRLLGRGLVLGSAGLASVLPEAAAAAVPVRLLETTTQTALLFAAGDPAAAGPVVILAQGVLQTMARKSLKLVAALVLILGVLGGTSAAVIHWNSQALPPSLVAVSEQAAEAPPDLPAEPEGNPVAVVEKTAARLLGGAGWLHGKDVSHICVGSADGSLLATVHLNWGKGILWNTATGERLREFSAPVEKNNGLTPWLSSVALSPDSKRLAYFDGRHRVVYVEEAVAGKQLQCLETFRKEPGSSATEGSVVFSPYGQYLALAVEDKLCLWEVATGKVHRQLDVPKDEKSPGQVSANYPDTERVGKFAFTPDGKMLAVQSTNHRRYDCMCRLALLDLATGKLVSAHHLTRPGYSPHLVVFAPDARSVALLWNDLAVSLNDTATGREVARFKHPSGGFRPALAWSPDSKRIAMPAPNDQLHLLDATTGKLLRPLSLAEPRPQTSGDDPRMRLATAFLSVVFAPDGKTLLAPGQSFVHRWDVASGKELTRSAGHQGPITRLVYAADGKTVVSLSYDMEQGYNATNVRPWDKTVRVWDVGTGQELHRLDLGQFEAKDQLVPWLQVTADGKFLTLRRSRDNQTCRWDLAAGKEAGRVQAEPSDLVPAAVSADGRLIALVRKSGGAPVGADEMINGYIHLWDTVANKEVQRFRCVRHYPRSVRGAREPVGDRMPPRFPPDNGAISPDGRTLAAAVVGGDLRVWDVVSGTELCRRPQFLGSWEVLQFSADGKTLIGSGRGMKGLNLYEAATGQLRHSCVLRHPGNYLSSFAISPDGRLAASAGNEMAAAASSEEESIHLIDTATAKEVGRLRGHRGRVLSLAFAPDGKSLASGSADTTIRLWNVADLQAAPAAVAWSEKELSGMWTALADSDARTAYRAIRLLTNGGPTVAFLGRQLRAAEPIKRVEPRRLQQLVADLESNDFRTRKQAEDELERLGEQARSALQKVLEGKPALDLRQRAEQLLARLDTMQPSPEVLRGVRAVEVLEHIGTPEARRLLDQLARGAAEARLTREAQAAGARMEHPGGPDRR